MPSTATPVSQSTSTPTPAEPAQFGFLVKWGSRGDGDGHFERPSGIAVDGAGNVYVADRDNHRVQVFDGESRFLAKWGTEGSGDSQFIDPLGIAVDGAGNIYVADTDNNRVQVFAPVRP